MGEMIFIGTDLRVASQVTFIPGAELKRNHALLTVINNRGRHPQTQVEASDEITLNFWGKYAGVAAFYLYPGKQINARGRLQSYTEDTGQIRPNGGRKLNRKIEVVVDRMQLLGDSMKHLNERIAMNLGVLKGAGRLPQEVILTAEELLMTHKSSMTDFNPTVSAQTGRYGLARVWSKDHNFWDQKIGAIITPNVNMANAGLSTIDLNDKAAVAARIAQLQAIIDVGAMPNVPVSTPELVTEAMVALEAGAGENMVADPFQE